MSTVAVCKESSLERKLCPVFTLFLHGVSVVAADLGYIFHGFVDGCRWVRRGTACRHFGLCTFHMCGCELRGYLY